ncbi:MAG TPA: hypothetical protein VMW22_04790 [Candidatus Desulfaltia sp.]|nr:hypothetical protein [Candidatus Desulfaltia sp.]
MAAGVRPKGAAGLDQTSFSLASFMHDLFLAYVEVTSGIVPAARFKTLTGLMRDTLYRVSGVPVMSFIRTHDVEGTLDSYCGFLEEAGLAVKATVVMEGYGQYRFNLRDCVFGASCRRLVSGSFVCPFAVYAAFLTEEASGRRVGLEQSEKTLVGSRTMILVGGKGLPQQKMKVSV